MKKHALVCNLMYKRDSHAARGDLIGLVKYMQYRDDRDRHIPQMAGVERWHDRGLGDNHRAITRRLMRLAGDSTNHDRVLVRQMVVSPHPALMVALPPHKRQRVLAELTDTMMERFFDACDLSTPEYSFVIHDPAAASGEQRLHSHVLFPATTPDIDGRRGYDLRREQMPLFHTIRDQTITEVLSRHLGRERVAALDAALPIDAPERRTEPEQTPETAASELDRWFGPSR